MFEERFEELRKKYQKAIPDKIGQIARALSALEKSFNLETATSLRMLVHNLAGNAGSFGYLKVSEICKEFDREMQDKIARIASFKPDSQWFAKLQDYLKQIVERFGVDV